MLRYDPRTNTVQRGEDLSVPDSGEMIWVHFDGSRTEGLERFIERLGVHPLAKKAMSTFGSMPRIDVYRNEAFISCFAVSEKDSWDKINILVGKNYVISRSENPLAVFSRLEQTFRSHPEHMAHPGHVLYHLFEKFNMSYLRVVDQIANEIQDLEKKVFAAPFANEIGQKTYRWKTRLHELRQIVEAQENVIKTIGRSDFPFINEEAGFYFQDLLDNVTRVVSAFDAFKETLTSILDLQISLKSDHMNAIMKTLTLVSVVFLPMTFVTSLYGMNFAHMPELKWKWGYAYALALIFALGAGIALYFKKKGWWGNS
ncbi:magnesium/cobalt transporter CorA [Bacillaceae bacterium]